MTKSRFLVTVALGISMMLTIAACTNDNTDRPSAESTNDESAQSDSDARASANSDDEPTTADNESTQDTDSDELRTETSAEFPIYESIAEMTEQSPYVFVGEVRSVGDQVNMARLPSDPREPDPHHYTVGQTYEVHVHEYLKGDGVDDLYTVQSEGSVYDAERDVGIEPTDEDIEIAREAGDFSPMDVGERYVFFVGPLRGFESDLNYFTTESAHPWRFKLDDEGVASPDSAIPEARERFDAKSLDQLTDEIESVDGDSGEGGEATSPP